MSSGKVISMRWDADKLAALSSFQDPKPLGKVVDRATKYGGRGAAVEASKLVRSRFMKISSTEMKQSIHTMHVSRGVDSFDQFDVDPSKRWPLVRWQSGKFNHKRPPKIGMAFRMIKGGGRFRVPGAFPADLGHYAGAFVRKTPARWPVRHLYTTAPLRYLARRVISDRVLERGREQMSKEFDRYAAYVLNGGKGGLR